MQLGHQRAVVFPETDHFCVAAARGKAARQALEQPGSESVELIDGAHIDLNAPDGVSALGRGIDLRLQHACIFGYPCTTAGELKSLTISRSLEQQITHARCL